ncbi:DUF4037 domain-containing protein [Oricola indica]|uniref:DUF4037 domain-containing protein n=1 Tax=Oricola indica TaxID=2872591 RepID=UPI003CCBD482
MKQGIGIDLSRRFFERLVAPLLESEFPDLPVAAARIGLGSEVLRFDTEMSADHDYGPTVQLFLPEAQFEEVAEPLMKALDRIMPEAFEAWNSRYPTNLRPPSGPDALPGMLGSDHGVELYTLPAWCDRFVDRKFLTELELQDWLSFPEQTILTVTGGEVFRDDFGDLTAMRQRLAWVPRDVWLYKLAAQWNRIAEERAFIGRTGESGDELGSSVIAARMVGNLMRLALLIERRYAPYPKWLGTAFSRLYCAPGLSPWLDDALAAPNWQDREVAIRRACMYLAELQLERGVPGAPKPEITSLHARPFRFVDSVAITNALRAAIEDETLRGLPEFGAVDQFVSANFVLAVPHYSKAAMEAVRKAGLDFGG